MAVEKIGVEIQCFKSFNFIFFPSSCMAISNRSHLKYQLYWNEFLRCGLIFDVFIAICCENLGWAENFDFE